MAPGAKVSFCWACSQIGFVLYILPTDQRRPTHLHPRGEGAAWRRSCRSCFVELSRSPFGRPVRLRPAGSSQLASFGSPIRRAAIFRDRRMERGGKATGSGLFCKNPARSGVAGAFATRRISRVGFVRSLVRPATVPTGIGPADAVRVRVSASFGTPPAARNTRNIQVAVGIGFVRYSMERGLAAAVTERSRRPGPPRRPQSPAPRIFSCPRFKDLRPWSAEPHIADCYSLDRRRIT